MCLCLSRSGLSCSLFIHVARTPPKTRSCWSHPGLWGSLFMFPLCVYMCVSVYFQYAKQRLNTTETLETVRWCWRNLSNSSHFGQIDSFPVREELWDFKISEGTFLFETKIYLYLEGTEILAAAHSGRKLHSPPVLNVCVCLFDGCVLVAGPWHIHFTVFAGQCNIQHHRITTLLFPLILIPEFCLSGPFFQTFVWTFLFYTTSVEFKYYLIYHHSLTVANFPHLVFIKQNKCSCCMQTLVQLLLLWLYYCTHTQVWVNTTDVSNRDWRQGPTQAEDPSIWM